MKKLLIFFILILLLLGINYEKLKNFTISDIFSGCLVQVVLNNMPEGMEYTANGSVYMVDCKINNVNKIFEENNVIGVTYKINKNDFSYKYVCDYLKIKIANQSKFECVGYSDVFDVCSYTYNKKTNVQVAQNKEFVFVGVPYILGSY